MLKEDTESELAEVISLKMGSRNRIIIPANICRKFGLKKDSYMFLRPDLKNNVLILYLQGHYQLSRAKVEKIE